MKGNGLEPRRLRDSTARAGTTGWKLACQLQLLSAHEGMPYLGSLPQTRSRRRLVLMTLRATAVILILLTVVGGASASAVLLIRRIHASTQAPVGAVPAGAAQPDLSRRGVQRARPVEPERAVASLDGWTAPSALAPSETVSARSASVPAPKPRAGREDDVKPKSSPASPPTLAPRPYPSFSTPSIRDREEPRSAPSLQPPPTPFPSPAPTASAEPLAAPRHASGPASPRLGTEPAARTHGIAEEAALLRQALLALRQGKDARRALELLDLYGARYPGGSLAPEASAARAQALLRLGDKPGALLILDGLPLVQGNQAVELRLARGELRSLAGRCSDALLDFEEVLEGGMGVHAEDRARALYGRISCRARIGDVAGAQQDRQRYLKEFPDGAAARSLRALP